jgi:hypothetical protein
VQPSGYSESTPAWRLLLQRRRHKRAGQGLPSPVGVLMRSLDLANIRSRREMALSYSADVDFRPPVDGVSRLDFASGRELTASAYRYSLEHLRQAEIGPPSP